MERKVAALKRLQEIIDELRGPKGCPWDRAQNLRDMSRYLLEEVSEAADAVEASQGRPTMQVSEELGDILMNILLSAKIAEDEGGFDIAHVADGISEKLIRRHPHVFGQTRADGIPQVLANWNAIKEEEKAESGSGTRQDSLLDRVPRSLPPLERSYELSLQAAKVGFDWPDARGALQKVLEEIDEVRAHMEGSAAGTGSSLEAELGDLLFAVVNLCRKLQIRPDVALRRTLKKFCGRFRAIEEQIPDLRNATLEQMEAIWQQAKAKESPD